MWDLRLKPGGIKWFVILWVLQISIGNNGLVTGRHIKRLRGENHDAVVVTGNFSFCKFKNSIASFASIN